MHGDSDQFRRVGISRKQHRGWPMSEWKANSWAILTERQQQIVDLVCEGRSNKAIARNFKLSEGTVKSHLHAIYAKLGVESRTALKIARDRRSRDSESK
jgi:DNA-binding NarL/FixJ family response regulator